MPRPASYRSELRLFFKTILLSPVLFAGTSFCQTANPATAEGSRMVSDAAAIRAMEQVLAKSGGAARWSTIRSSKEVFSIPTADGTGERLSHFLDDWTSDVSRYRRGVAGMQTAPEEHNGSLTYNVTVGGKTVTIPEFDQARTMVGRLPAAAAEIMLRRGNYVLKLAKSRPCDTDTVCIDVFDKNGAGDPTVPEQQWTISSSTGLPISIASMVFAIGPPQMNRLRVVHFLQYGTEDNVIVPVSIEVAAPASGKRTWKLVSFKSNPEFDAAKFDQEVR